MTDEINRIIVGLGGQGSRIVNEVRKAVLAQGEPPKGLDFVAIDSDRLALSSLDSVPEDQRVHVSAPDDNITETIVPWLPHEFRPKAGGGCGMQRLTGKAMYLVHKPRIMEAIREVARRMRQRTQNPNFMVVIVNAFGGGTGSGMLVDFSIDVRAELTEITGQEPVLFGIGVLPARSETIQRANGVAALKELHLLLSHKEPVLVGGRDYSSPFELYFLVGREVMGIEKDDDVLKTIVRFTIDLGLIPSSSRDAAAAGKGAGWVDLQDIRTLVKGAGHMFSTFGSYRAVFPAQQLLELFDVRDETERLRAQMPSFTTELDAQRRAIEDRKIGLGALEEKARLARERVARLREQGILGANRPELAAFLQQAARLEERFRKEQQEIERFESDFPALQKKRDEATLRMRELEVRAQALHAALTAPPQTRTTTTIALRDDEIARLDASRHLVREGTFLSLMQELGRLPEYYDRTMEVVGKSKILHLPLLNYRMSFQTASAFSAPVLAQLKRHGFVRFDAAGNPTVTDDQLWMIMAMLGSRPENVDASRVSGRAFKESVEGNVARRAEVKIVPSATKRFEVVIHSWMVGLQIAPVAPGYPPRLRELEWLMPEYEQTAREGGLAQHHAFLYGDPLAFAKLTGVPVERADSSTTNELVTKFWAAYAPVDEQQSWTQLPPLVAESLLAAQDVAHAAAALAEALDELRTGDASLPALDRLRVTLHEEGGRVAAFSRVFAEDQHALKTRLAATAAQLERAKHAPRDPEHLLAMQELAAEARSAVEHAAGSIEQMQAALPEAMGTALAAARESGHATNRSAARWEATAAQAEGDAATLHESAADAHRHLRDLEQQLARVQDLLAAKARVPFRSALGRLRAPAPLPEDAPAQEVTE